MIDSSTYVSIENYENQFFKSNFTHIHVYVFRLSFLTTLDIYIYIYKDYFKGCLTGWKRFYASILWPKTYALVHLSLKEAVAFVRHRVLWLRSLLIFIVWMNWKLCSQHPFQVSVLVTHLDPCIDWLAMYWEPYIENERLLLHYKSNCVLG